MRQHYKLARTCVIRHVCARFLHMKHSASLWPGITNPNAKEIVQTLFNTPGVHTDRGDFEDYFNKLPPGLKSYQAWLREELNHSNLAQRLAAGLDWLPDFAKELPSPLDFLFKFVQPHALKEAVPHLVIFLEWYVDPQRAAPMARKATIWAILIGLFLLCGIAALVVFNLADAMWLVMYMALYGAASYGFLISLLTQGVSNSAKRSVNATELYWYFKREFDEQSNEFSEVVS